MTEAGGADAPLPEAAWGTLVAAYFILIGLPSGLTLMTWWLRRAEAVSGGAAARARAAERYGSWITMAALLGSGVILIVDLGRPERFSLMLTRFDNLGSPIAVGAKLIALKAFLLAVLLYLSERRRRGAPNADAEASGVGKAFGNALPWLLLVLSFALAVYPAAVLARSWASPLGGSSGAALLFLLTALLMGAAAVALLGVLTGGAAPDAARFVRSCRTILLGLITAYGVALVFEGLSLGGDPADRSLLGDVLTGGGATTFWGLVVGAGIALPSAGLAFARGNRAAIAVSASAVLVGAAAARYMLFATGH